MVGLGRFELPTSRLSGVRSNQLSYRPDSSTAFRLGQYSETESQLNVSRTRSLKTK